jgi:uncharacterized membrane protein
VGVTWEFAGGKKWTVGHILPISTQRATLLPGTLMLRHLQTIASGKKSSHHGICDI